MTCDDFLNSAAAYALGALDANEQRAMDAHLVEPREHPGCEAAVRDALETAAALARALPGMVSPGAVWEGIEAQVRPGAKPVPGRVASRTLRTAPMWMALAAGLVALLAVANSARLSARESRSAARATQLRVKQQGWWKWREPASSRSRPNRVPAGCPGCACS